MFHLQNSFNFYSVKKAQIRAAPQTELVLAVWALIKYRNRWNRIKISLFQGVIWLEACRWRCKYDMVGLWRDSGHPVIMNELFCPQVTLTPPSQRHPGSMMRVVFTACCSNNVLVSQNPQECLHVCWYLCCVMVWCTLNNRSKHLLQASTEPFEAFVRDRWLKLVKELPALQHMYINGSEAGVGLDAGPGSVNVQPLSGRSSLHHPASFGMGEQFFWNCNKQPPTDTAPSPYRLLLPTLRLHTL